MCEKLLKKFENDQSVNIRDIIADSILHHSEQRFNCPIPLPPFLVNNYKEKDPCGLARIYADSALVEVRLSIIYYIVWNISNKCGELILVQRVINLEANF